MTLSSSIVWTLDDEHGALLGLGDGCTRLLLGVELDDELLLDLGVDLLAAGKRRDDDPALVAVDVEPLGAGPIDGVDWSAGSGTPLCCVPRSVMTSSP